MPDRLDDIMEAFEFLDDWEERFEYLIGLGKALPGLPDAEKVAANKVEGCTSQVWLTSSVAERDGEPVLHFDADSDAHIVRGLIAVLLAAYSDRTVDEILATDVDAAFREMGLDKHLSPNRRNGFSAMVGRINGTAKAVREARAA